MRKLIQAKILGAALLFTGDKTKCIDSDWLEWRCIKRTIRGLAAWHSRARPETKCDFSVTYVLHPFVVWTHRSVCNVTLPPKAAWNGSIWAAFFTPKSPVHGDKSPFLTFYCLCWATYCLSVQKGVQRLFMLLLNASPLSFVCSAWFDLGGH